MRSLPVRQFGDRRFESSAVLETRPPMALQLLRQRYQPGDSAGSVREKNGFAAFGQENSVGVVEAEPMIDAIRAASQSLKQLIKINEQVRADSASALAARDAELEIERSRVASLRAEIEKSQAEIERLLADNRTVVESYEARTTALTARLHKSEQRAKSCENLMEYYYNKLHPELSMALELASDVIRKAGQSRAVS